MKTIAIFLTLVVAAYAGHASSYASRHDDNSHGYGHGGESYGVGVSHHDYHHHPAYKFEYGVKDPKTGDHKSQWEHRDGDIVHGEYTLDEADGTKRVVKYHADGKTGFHAHVERVGHAHHPEVYHHDHGYGHHY